MILEFELNDWVVLKNIFININEIIDEVVIECTFDGLKFKGIDRGHVCFFEGNLQNDLFEKYSLENPFLMYVDLHELVKIFKRGKSKDILLFQADEEIIKIVFKNKNKRTFQLTQIDMSDNMRDLPTLEYSTVFECDFDSIKNSLQDAYLYSDVLTFTCENNNLLLSCEGANGNYENECPLDNPINVGCSASYTVDWLSKIFNTKLSSNNFKIHMGDDYPMLIEIYSENMTMTYLLAPRLSDG